MIRRPLLSGALPPGAPVLFGALLAVATVPLQAQERTDAAARERAFQEELRAPRPIEAGESVWLEELTWMEIRDLMAAGTTTAVVSTGGIEQNGPYLALGKHNYVLEGACEGIARALGNALCAPIIKLVPEGDIDPPSGHMRYPGTLSVRQETFEMMLTDVVRSLQAHGFTDIVLIGDSGGNQSGMRAVAEALNAEWTTARVHYIPEFYEYARAFEFMETELGIREPVNDGIHDDFVITSIMLARDPATVRFHQRLRAGKATINGLSLEPLEEVQEVGRKILAFRVEHAVKAIRASLAAAN